MRGPRYGGKYSDRKLDCEQELGPMFQVLVNLAEDAGWSSQECYLAIINLCVRNVTDEMQNDAVREIVDRQRSAGV